MKLRKINKNGFLLAEQVIKIVLGVIAVAFLVYLLTAVYFSKVNEQKKAEAVNSLEGKTKLKEEIKRVHDGGVFNNQGISIHNPKGWYLFTFTGKNVKPNACAGVNCICICSNVWIGSPWKTEMERQAEECDEDGACILTPELKNYDGELEIKIETDTVVFVKKIQGGFLEVFQ